MSLLSILFRVRLPSLLYRLWPCAATARLPLAAMCDEPGQAGLEMVLLAWRCGGLGLGEAVVRRGG